MTSTLDADVGYWQQRPDLADREQMSEYPLVFTGTAPAHARAVLYTDPAGMPWSPVARRRTGDPLSVHVLPVGLLMQRYGLHACRSWLPLCVALLRGESRWIALGDDLGHVEITDGHIRGATLTRGIPALSVDIGLHAARLGGARSLPVDSPLFGLASARGVAEHLRVRDVADADWSSPDGRIEFEPVAREPVPEGSIVPPRPPSSKGVPRRLLPLWTYLVQHRYGFDLLRTGEGAPVVGDVTIVLPTATILAQWVRIKTDDPAWPDLCTAAGIERRLALPWVFRITRYLHAFAADQPSFAAAQTEQDARDINTTLTLGKQRLMIISFFQGVLV